MHFLVVQTGHCIFYNMLKFYVQEGIPACQQHYEMLQVEACSLGDGDHLDYFSSPPSHHIFHSGRLWIIKCVPFEVKEE